MLLWQLSILEIAYTCAREESGNLREIEKCRVALFPAFLNFHSSRKSSECVSITVFCSLSAYMYMYVMCVYVLHVVDVVYVMCVYVLHVVDVVYVMCVYVLHVVDVVYVMCVYVLHVVDVVYVMCVCTACC